MQSHLKMEGRGEESFQMPQERRAFPLCHAESAHHGSCPFTELHLRFSLHRALQRNQFGTKTQTKFLMITTILIIAFLH